MNVKCEASGCNNPQFSKGLCEKHHGRLHGTFCHRKLSASQVREIRALATVLPKEAIEKRFDTIVSPQTITDVIRGRTWRYL